MLDFIFGSNNPKIPLVLENILRDISKASNYRSERSNSLDWRPMYQHIVDEYTINYNWNLTILFKNKLIYESSNKYFKSLVEDRVQALILSEHEKRYIKKKNSIKINQEEFLNRGKNDIIKPS